MYNDINWRFWEDDCGGDIISIGCVYMKEIQRLYEANNLVCDDDLRHFQNMLVWNL